MKYIKNTDRGVIREENQDRADIFENDDVIVAVLCDGMGGHFGGSLASSITINTFKQRMSFISKNEDEIYDWFKETIKNAKQNMIQEAGDDINKKDMGTTVTSAIIFKETKNIVIFNIGDSRTYLFNGVLKQITIDHNLMNYYIQKENMSEFEASKIPGAHALTSALGPSKQTNIEAFMIDSESLITSIKSKESKSKSWFKKSKKEKEDITNNNVDTSENQKIYLILTSDGIHDFITKPHFESIIANPLTSIEEKTNELISAGIKGSSTDNLTCIIVEVN